MIAQREVAAGPRELRPRPAEIRRPPAARVALVHGAWLLFAGGWPLLSSRRSNKEAGACLASIGAALIASGARGKVARELRLLGAAVAVTIAALDFYSAGMRRRRSPLYLLNGLAQLAFAASWGAAELKEDLSARRPPEPAFA